MQVFSLFPMMSVSESQWYILTTHALDKARNPFDLFLQRQGGINEGVQILVDNLGLKLFIFDSLRRVRQSKSFKERGSLSLSHHGPLIRVTFGDSSTHTMISRQRPCSSSPTRRFLPGNAVLAVFNRPAVKIRHTVYNASVLLHLFTVG